MIKPRFASKASSRGQQNEQSARPLPHRGVGLTTQELHQLLTTDHFETTSNNGFDKAVSRQRMLLKICNLLDHQNNIHQRIELMTSARTGTHSIDEQTSHFKSVCPPELLTELRNIATRQQYIGNGPEISGIEVLVNHYSSLIQETLCTPMNTLSRIDVHKLSDNKLAEWYDWCEQVEQKMDELEKRLQLAAEFFTPATLQQIARLTDCNKQQMNLIIPCFELSLTEIKEPDPV